MSPYSHCVSITEVICGQAPLNRYGGVWIDAEWQVLGIGSVARPARQ